MEWVPVKDGEKAPEPKGVESGYIKPDTQLFKQVCFFKKRPDMTLEQFKDYYENGHSKLAKKIGAPFLPGAIRYVRRYLKPERNPITWEIHDPGYDCIMEIWWKNREDFDKAMVGVHDPKFLDKRMEDEKKLFASHSNPVVSVQELDEPLGPNGSTLKWMPRIRA
jgi:hypothetical protein